MLWSKADIGVDMSETIAKFEREHGHKIAMWAIVAIVTYLVIAQWLPGGPYQMKNGNAWIFQKDLKQGHNMISTLLMLLRWKQDGWEVHPINFDSEFVGWF